MTYKTAIVGVSGYRARGHAEAYRLITRGKLVAVSTRNRENLDAFGDMFDIGVRYTDYREMFAREQPDVVHVNTPPSVRVEILEAAAEAGVPALIFEKPIALQGEDYRRLCELDALVSTKVAVNHQLHFHPNRLALQERVARGDIGDVVRLDATCRLNLVHQGTHMLEAVRAFNSGAKATGVLAQIGGDSHLAESAKAHSAPDHTLADIAFDNGSRATLLCGPHSPIVKPDAQTPFHKRIAVVGTRGRLEWTMWGWSLVTDDNVCDSGEHDYFEQDIQGQAALTNAMFNWLEDDNKPHPLRLSEALADFNIVLGIYESGLSRKPVALPCEARDNLLDAAREALRS